MSERREARTTTSRIELPLPLLTREVIVDGKLVRVVKLQDDPDCLRASIAGSPDKGYTLTYRGDEDAVITMLGQALRAFGSGKVAP